VGPRGDVAFRLLLVVLSLVAAAVIVSALVDGRAYYRASYGDRPHLPERHAFDSGGTRGHGYGIVGAFLILVMQLYSLRKRTRRFNGLGTPAQWLQVHICFGIVGPLLVVLHSAFRVQGLVAVSFWSMVAVALSGVFGRYLYQQIPRNLAGQELSMQEIAALERSLAAQQAAEKRPRELARLARRRARLERRVRRVESVRRIFHWWHVVHKPFAIVMMLIMAVHVTVTMSLGYTWVF
jgi:hypothetical protein